MDSIVVQSETFEFSRDIFERNLLLLDKKHFAPTLPTLDLEALAETPPAELTLGQESQLVLRLSDVNGSYLMNSKYNPTGEANAILSETSIDEDTNVVVVFGFGNGALLRELMTRENISKIKIVVIEPSLDIFAWTLGHEDFSDVLSHDSMNVVAVSEVEVAAGSLMPFLSLLTLKNWAPVIPPPVARSLSGFLKAFVRRLDELVTAQKLGFATTADTSDLFMTNAFMNSKYAAASPGIIHLRQIWKGKPAVLVSAGPSLEKQLGTLKQYENKVLIVAVGAALRTLRNAGIEPHIVVTVDPFNVMYDHFKGLKSEGAWLLSDMAGNHDIIKNFSEKMIFGHSTPQMEHLFRHLIDDRGLMVSGGSVANSAFSAAVIMGASPIVFIGQDLAFTGGASHAQGNVKRFEIDDEIVKTEPQKYKKVRGYYGDEVITESKMNSYRIWFERMIPTVKDSKVINATEGGADIEGAENRPFADVIKENALSEEFSFDEIIKGANDYKPVEEAVYRKRVLRLRNQVRRIQNLASEAAKSAGRVLKGVEQDMEPAELDKLKVRYNRVMKVMRRQKTAGDLFVTGFVQKGIMFIQRRQALFNETEKDQMFSNYTYQLTLKNACSKADSILERFLKTFNPPSGLKK